MPRFSNRDRFILPPGDALLAGGRGPADTPVPPHGLGFAFLLRRRRWGVGLLGLLCLLAACVAPPSGPQAPASTSPTPVALPPTAAPGETTLALVGGTLIDGTGAPPVVDAVLLIRGNRILAVGRRADVAIPAGAQVVEVAGATLLPGFINAHVHGGYDADALAAWAAGGVTTVRDLAARPGLVDFSFRDEAWTTPGLARLVAAGPMVTVPDGYPIAYWGMPALTVSSAEDARHQTTALLDQGADLIKIPLESGAIFGQSMPMLSPAEAAAIVELAHDRGKRVSAHVTVAADLPAALDAGVDDIAHMATDRVPDEVLRRMVEAGVLWVPTLELWQGVGLRRPAIADNLRRFVVAGGQVALGTDYLGAPNVHFDLGMPITEIERMAEAGMTPMQIIVAATRNGAHVCGLDGELGTVEPGKLADLLAVDGDPLTDLRALARTLLVVRDGVIIVHKAGPPRPVGTATATLPTIVETPAATPDVVATVVAAQQPSLFGSYPSPDGKWQANVVTYACVKTDELDESAYELLRLTYLPSGDETMADSQLLNCGGLGAFGLAGLFWSPNSRYFYYTDAREGVPDGCGHWEPPIIRLDVSTWNKAYLGAGPLAPDGSKLATWQGHELAVWDVDGGELGRAPAIAPGAETGPIAWSPEGHALVYVQAASYCPLSGKSYLVRVDLPELEQTLLLESETPTFGSVVWDSPDQLRLLGDDAKEWRYDLRTRDLEPLP